ncbi:MAG: helicase-related protein, partial [Candidatus Rhabdochlamydia sp.]
MTSAISSLNSPVFSSLAEYEKMGSFEESSSEALNSMRNSDSLDLYRKVFAYIQNIPQPEEIKIELVRWIMVLNNQGKEEISFTDYEELVKETVDFSAKWGRASLLSFHKNVEKCSLDDLIATFRLSNQIENIDYIRVQLERFKQKEIDFIGLLEDLKRIESKSNRIPEQKELKPILERFKGEDPNVLFPLDEKFLAIIKRQYAVVENYCREWQHKGLGWLVSKAGTIRAKKTEFQEEDILKLIAIGRLALYDTCKLYLHHIQILVILGQLCYAKGCMAQVKTGEGKSMISTLLAFVLAMQNKSVHLISSARSLSLRDQLKLFSFFQLFSIKTSHICNDNPEQSCFKAQILYGTASDFEFAIMREMLYLTPLFEQKVNLNKQKRFDCVIVDEVDNLTIDTARNHARLSHPAEVSYAWVYYPVLNFVKERFAKDLSDELFSESTHQDLRRILQGLQPVPLKDDQLKTWLQSAFSALFLLEEHEDYIIKKSINEEKILVVDAKNTGRIMHAVRWGKGLHECVEIKHKIEPKKETLSPLSLAHCVLYAMYDSVFGLTGTLGSQLEREEIKEIYGIDSFDVPTYNPCIRKDSPVKILSSNEEWLEAILQVVKDCIAQDRPILVLSETIRDSQIIEELLKKENIPLEMLNEIQEKTEESILNRAGISKAVTVATNTAGRGTDIKLTQRSLQQGGLHVLLTFYPSSERVGAQARGRAGRQGEPGSSEIIVSLENLSLNVSNRSQEEVIQLLEQKRLAQTRIDKNVHICLADVERYFFSLAAEFFTVFAQFSQSFHEEIFVERCIQVLSNQKLVKEPKKSLNKKDFHLAQTAIELIPSKASKIKWKIFLQQVGEQIKSKTINQWSIQFYQEVERLVSGSNMERLTNIKEQIQQIFGEKGNFFSDSLIAMIIDSRIKEIMELKQKIRTLYDQ